MKTPKARERCRYLPPVKSGTQGGTTRRKENFDASLHGRSSSRGRLDCRSGRRRAQARSGGSGKTRSRLHALLVRRGIRESLLSRERAEQGGRRGGPPGGSRAGGGRDLGGGRAFLIGCPCSAGEQGQHPLSPGRHRLPRSEESG